MPISAVRDITVPEAQTQMTVFGPLSDRDLDFPGVDTQHSTHRLHPYVAAMNPPLARTLLETYTPARAVVLDPFCGGGCVLVESLLSGRQSIGLDVNPLSYILSVAKTTRVGNRELCEVWEFFSKKENVRRLSGESLQLGDKALYWFKPETIPDISRVRVAIDKFKDSVAYPLLQVIFSATVRSAMTTYRGEVRLRKLQGPDFDRFEPEPIDIFVKRLSEALAVVAALPVDHRPQVEMGDVTSIPLADNSVDSVICSPPYADDKNGVGYFQFSKVMLECIGFAPSYINEWKSRFLGGVVLRKSATPELPASPSLISCVASASSISDRLAREAIAFYSDYDIGLGEMLRVSRDYVVIVIGNRVLGRTFFDNAAITTELMQQHGAPLCGYYKREIKKKRIPNLGGDGGGISTEHVLVYKKL